jgi:hypothetical protein
MPLEMHVQSRTSYDRDGFYTIHIEAGVQGVRVDELARENEAD